MVPSPAWRRFVESLAPGPRAEVGAAHAAAFDRRWTEARAVLTHADEEAFAAYLAERMPAEGVGVALERLHVRDLAFAFALSAGRADALSAFEREYVPALTAAVRRATPSVDVGDLLQEVRIHVLVGHPNPPRIREYRGEGPLRAWLRVVVLRAALNRVTRSSKETPVEDAFFDAMVGNTGFSSTNGIFVHRDTQAVKDALRHALPLLSNREKSLMQLAFIDGASLEELGATYGVHRSTIARWLELARDRVKREIETQLRDRLGMSPSEAEVLIRTTMGSVDSPVARLLTERR